MSSTASRLEPDLELESVLKLWTDFNSSLVPREIFQKACKAAIDLLGADHSTFVQFDKNYRSGRVRAEDFSEALQSQSDRPKAAGMTIPLAGVPEEDPLFYGDGLIRCDDVASLGDGIFRSNLLMMGVQSVLIVRVKSKDRVLGSFSLDSIRHKRTFRNRDIQLMKLMAEAIAQALGNALVYERERYRSKLLEALDESRGELKRAGNEMELRASILKTALKLCGWSAGALFRYSGDQRELHLVRSSGLEERNLPEAEQRIITGNSDSWIWREVFARQGRAAQIASRAEYPEIFEYNSLFRPFERALVLPITRFDDVDSALLLLDDAPERLWQEDELEYLLELSTRATTATERQGWWDEVGDTLVQQFSLLFSQSPQSEEDVDRMLYHFLTMVTAGFGLRFNRAAVFLLNDSREILEPRFAVGQFEKEQWHERCKSDGARGSDQFDKWVQQPYGSHPATEMEVWARDEKPFPLDDPANGVLREALDSNYILLKDASQLSRLPPRLRDNWRHTSPLVFVRLYDGIESVGLLIADKEWTERHIGAKDLHLLQIFCKEAARGVASYWQRLRIPEINSKFEFVSSIKADPAFASLEEREVLQRISEAVSKGLGNAIVGVLCINRNGVWRSHFGSAPAWINSIDPFFRDGVGGRVMESRAVEVVEEDRVAPVMKEHGIRGITFLPLLRENRAIGLIVALHQRPLTNRRLDNSTLERYASVGSEVYNSWSTLHFLRALQRRMEEITFQITRGSASRAMAEAAQRLFDAKTVTFWPYDSRKSEFLPTPVRLGFSDELPSPSANGLTHRILHELGYYSIGDVQAAREELHPKTFEFLQKYNQHSVEGIAIGSRNERLGVLYLTYGEPRDFALGGARDNLESFARNVAVVLESAQAFESGRNFLEATQEVSRVLALGNKQQALRSVAARTLSSVRCYSVTIFSLNRSGDPDFPPVVEGADQEMVEREDRDDSTRLVRKLIANQEITIARNAEEVKRKFESKFAERERIQTTFAIPLQFHNVDVGLMFASFRKELPERDIEPVKNLLSSFAYQAAVATGNANRFRDLGDLSANLLKNGEREGVLNIAAEFIKKELQPTHCVFALKERSQLRIIVQRGWTDKLFQEVVEDDSHAAFTVRKKEPNCFSSLREVRENPYFEGFNPPERLIQAGVSSGIGVPLFSSEDVCGALLLHSTKEDRFKEEDVSYVSLIANEAMAALRSASMLRTVKAQYEVAKIAAEYGSITKASDILRKVVQVCLESLVDGANEPKASAASIELYDPEIPAIIEGHESPHAVLALSKPLYEGAHHVGQIEIWNEGSRAFSDDDKHLVNSVAALVIMFAKQVREQQRVLSNLAYTTHGYERCAASLQYVNLLLDGAASDFPEHHREALVDLRDALLRFDDHHETMNHTVKVLTGTLAASLEISGLPRIYELLRASAGRFSDMAEKKQIKMSLPDETSSATRIRVKIDADLLSSVFNNLLGNALKFTGPSTKVTCSISHRGTNVFIEIVDEGPGISPEAKARMFTQWYQAEEHKGLQAPGFGVGLFICREIVELHRGRIWVESPVAAGRGSRFCVDLPVYR